MSNRVFIKSPNLITSLQASGEFLLHLMEYFPHRATVKDVKTGKYILTNQGVLNLFNMTSSNDILGATAADVHHMLHDYWGESYLTLINTIDKKVIYDQKTVQDETRVMRTPKGFIFARKMVKVPITGLRGKVIAILTFWEFTPIKPKTLFKWYLNFYSNKINAIDLFLKHIQLRNYFNNLPTETEVFTLLTMRNNSSYKSVSQLLQIQPKTVEHRIEGLRSKLDYGSLQGLLSDLRDRELWILPEMTDHS